MGTMMFAKDAILTDSEKNLVRKCLFLYQAKLWKDVGNITTKDKDLMKNIIDKLHLTHDHPTYY